MFAVSASLFLLCACGSPGAPASDLTVARISVIGNGQRGFAGGQLPNPIEVQLVNSNSRAVSVRRLVRFSIVDGGGSLSDTSVTTNDRGYAAVTWSLGPTSGPQHLTVKLADAPEIAEQSVVAHAVSLDDAELVVIAGATSGNIGLVLRTDDAVRTYTLTWPDTILRLLPRSSAGTWEEVTAFTVGHPPVAVVRPWTDLVDTIHIAFQAPIQVPFVIWLTTDFDTTAVRAQHDLQWLDWQWRIQMTGLRVGQVRIDSAPDFSFNCGETTSPYYDATAINVFYTKNPSPFACDARVIRMHATHPLTFTDPYRFVMAHEVGHTLSLDHATDSLNVMWPQARPGAKLTTGQIYNMHFSDWGALNSVLGRRPPGTRNCRVTALFCPAQTFAEW